MLYAWLVVASCWAGLASRGVALGLEPAPDWLYSDLEPPPPTRRITPKSVFVAPTFSACGPGYRHDPVAGRCVRVVKVNQQAQWDFFLQKLNAMYAPPEPTKNKAPSGPLHLALPLDPLTTSTAATTTTEPTTASTVPPTTTVYSTTDIPTTTVYTTTNPTTFQSTYTEPSTTFTSPTTNLPDTSYPSTEYSTEGSTESTSSLSTDFTTDATTLSESVASSMQHFALELPVKAKCKTPFQVTNLDSELSNVDCEEITTSSPPVKHQSYIRFPSQKKKPSYVRFPDRTWQSSSAYWWPHGSWERLPLPSSYQKIQHFPTWYRNPMWARSAST